MKKTVLTLSVATLAMAAAPAAMAQDDGTETDVETNDTDTDTETPETDVDTPETEDPEASNGAIVTRSVLTEERQIFDENDEPVLDDEGNPTYEIVELDGWQQTVETPSGHIHTVTKEVGSPAVVTHIRPEGHGRPERVAAAERPERPARPERPERPDRPDKPDKPERPDRPGRPS